MISQKQKIQHLFWRAGFGASIQNIEEFENQNIKTVTQDLFAKSEKIEKLKVVDGSPPKIQDLRQMSKSEKQTMRKENRQKVRDLNKNWFNQMVNSEAQVLEKMTLFWHDHFACIHKNVYGGQIQINTLKKYALGNFGEMVQAIAKDPAMLFFLNNQQNRKQKPNENFARELLELFTIGRGNYTEKDIKEAARAFTGWAANGDEFIFRTRLHDFGQKTFMGKTGNFTGDDIIKIILGNPKTANYITRKIYKYFVNERVDENIVKELSQQFYQSNYDIKALMQSIFTSDWFYLAKNIGVKIKSPIEYLVGFQRQFSVKFPEENTILFIQKILGQMLFNPPNVAGWEDGRAWIDSSTLMFRLRIPGLFFYSTAAYISAKEEADAQKMKLGKRTLKKFQANFNWAGLEQSFSKSKNIVGDVSEYILQTTTKDLRSIMQKVVDNSNDKLKTLAIALASTPEYQVC